MRIVYHADSDDFKIELSHQWTPNQASIWAVHGEILQVSIVDYDDDRDLCPEFIYSHVITGKTYLCLVTPESADWMMIDWTQPPPSEYWVNTHMKGGVQVCSTYIYDGSVIRKSSLSDACKNFGIPEFNEGEYADGEIDDTKEIDMYFSTKVSIR